MVVAFSACIDIYRKYAFVIHTKNSSRLLSSIARYIQFVCIVRIKIIIQNVFLFRRVFFSTRSGDGPFLRRLTIHIQVSLVDSTSRPVVILAVILFVVIFVVVVIIIICHRCQEVRPAKPRAARVTQARFTRRSSSPLR